MGSLEALMQDFDLLFSSVFNNKNYHFTSMADCDIRYPIIDQRFNDEEQQIIIAATGATKEDFEIKLTDDILSIKRVHSSDQGNEKYKYVKNNISRKKFDIAFKIPKKWDAENLNVQLDLGELIITIPVKEEEKPKVKDFSIG
jgi:HSP20 family protein